MPRVSVVIPAYNTAPYLAATLESVLQQSYADFEIIVVDDGSTDETLAVAEAVVERFAPRVTVLSKANGGPAAARNLAMQKSTGEFIAFLDSDDLWLPDKLAVQVAFLDENPEVGATYGEAWMFTEAEGEKQLLQKIGWPGAATFKQLLFGDFIPNSTVVLRRSCLAIAGWLNESRALIGVEDYEYFLRLAKFIRWHGLARPLAYYRVRQGNLMGAGDDIEKGVELPLRVLDEIERQFPQLWQETGVDRALLLARLHVRAGFAWKQRGAWRNCLAQYRRALRCSWHPRVWRMLVAATLLPRWS